MSVPISIVRSNSSTKSQQLAELLHFPASPNYSCERHACAFPSWPDRPTLNSPDLSAHSEDSGFFSDLDLAGHSVGMQRVRSNQRPSNYLELEFEDDDEDDSSDNSCAVSLSSTPETQRKPPKRSTELMRLQTLLNPSLPQSKRSLSVASISPQPQTLPTFATLTSATNICLSLEQLYSITRGGASQSCDI
ncbi:hypothetical protein TWF173_008958 [Orbilia oligospora]|nr:hypothetical protein TWF173_008958 [Orbilia oligospora]